MTYDINIVVRNTAVANIFLNGCTLDNWHPTFFGFLKVVISLSFLPGHSVMPKTF